MKDLTIRNQKVPRSGMCISGQKSSVQSFYVHLENMTGPLVAELNGTHFKFACALAAISLITINIDNVGIRRNISAQLPKYVGRKSG